MVLSVVLAAFVLVLPVELPDKTMIATLVLTTRFRAWPVLAGVSEAYAAGHGFAPTAVLSGRDHHLRAVEHVLTGLRAGDVSTLRGRTV